MSLKSRLRAAKRAVKGFARGLRGGSIAEAFKQFGNSIGELINYKQDTPRRELRNEIQATRSYLTKRVEKLRDEAETGGLKNEALNLMNRAEKLQSLADQLETPKVQKSFLGIKKIKASNSDEYLNPYRKNLEDVKAAYITEKEDLRAARETVNKAQRSNAIFAEQMRIAADRGKTALFDEGDVARANALMFFNYYKTDWQGEEGDRYAAILAKHPGETLWDLFEDARSDKGEKGWWEFVADWLGMNYDDIDTTSETWQRSVEAAFAALDSDQQAVISAAWNMR